MSKFIDNVQSKPIKRTCEEKTYICEKVYFMEIPDSEVFNSKYLTTYSKYVLKENNSNNKTQ